MVHHLFNLALLRQCFCERSSCFPELGSEPSFAAVNQQTQRRYILVQGWLQQRRCILSDFKETLLQISQRHSIELVVLEDIRQLIQPDSLNCRWPIAANHGDRLQRLHPGFNGFPNIDSSTAPADLDNLLLIPALQCLPWLEVIAQEERARLHRRPAKRLHFQHLSENLAALPGQLRQARCQQFSMQHIQLKQGRRLGSDSALQQNLNPREMPLRKLLPCDLVIRLIRAQAALAMHHHSIRQGSCQPVRRRCLP